MCIINNININNEMILIMDNINNIINDNSNININENNNNNNIILIIMAIMCNINNNSNNVENGQW